MKDNFTRKKNIDTENVNSNSKNAKKEENQIWLSVSEAAKIGGVQTKTIRRAIKFGTLRYKIVKNRYLVDLKTLIIFLHTNTKLKNKLHEKGLGQYIREWEMEM